MEVKRTLVWLICMGMISLSCQRTNTAAISNNSIKHVVVIGFDGLSPDGLRQAHTPTFDQLIAEGASSMHARAVLPTSSSSNWASMIMGAGPEQHGITSNDWERDDFVLPTVVQDDAFLFPTIFKLIDDQLENPEIGAIYHWDGFGRLFEKAAVDFEKNPEDEIQTAQLAASYIKEKQPTFSFVHFDHIDHAGHTYGHGTPEYYQSVEKADSFLSLIMDSIVSSEMVANTLVIISSDHGGVGKGHGGESLAEIEIPFIAWGSNVKKGYVVQVPVYQYDNAATVAYALGVQTPMAWIGKPITSIFEGVAVIDAYPIRPLLKAPVIESVDSTKQATGGGLFKDQIMVRIQNPNQNGELRYTVDGSFPDEQSKRYEEGFVLKKNAVIKAAVFQEGRMISQISEAYFRIRNKETMSVTYRLFYLDDLKWYPDLSGINPDHIGHSYEFSSHEIQHPIEDNTAIEFTAILEVETADTYTFYTRSDDGSLLWVDNQLVVDNNGDHGVVEKRGRIALEPGNHQLRIGWFNAGGSGSLEVFYKTSTKPKQILSTTILKP